MDAPLSLLRREGGLRGEVATAERTGGDMGGGRELACAACGHRVTSGAARIEMTGAHEHTFSNPAGLVFRIGCFSRAEGCVPVGPSSAHWSWFPPHRWRIGHCAACGLHLGWLFTSEGSRFHGLILDRLVETEMPE